MSKIRLNDLNKQAFTNHKDGIIKNTLPSEIGRDLTQSIKLQDDFYLIKSDYTFKTDTQIQSEQKEEKLIITLSLKGNSSYKNLDNKKINFKEGYTTVAFLKKSMGFREYEDNEVSQIRLILKEDFLKRNFSPKLLEKYLKHTKEDLNLINFSPTIIQSQLILNEMLLYDNKEQAGNFYIQSKTLELLYLEINKLERKKQLIILDDYDKDAIYKAKEILINNIQNPPSIIDLAKLVHLNEVKLKIGFKEVFNTSPYKLLLKYKMNKAKILLEQGDYNISEIAKLSGYKFATNFTNAFFKEFKIRPKDFMKTKNYY